MSKRLIRRKFLQAGGFGALAAGLRASFPSQLWASTGLQSPPDTGKPLSDLVIRKEKIEIDGRATTATTINGSVPGPALRFREGDTVTIRVRNDMAETTSIHWHGILLPFEMDGVPGVSFPGIKPGETFTYQYRLRQSGTYWYHSHSGMQEQTGMYGAYLIDPADGEPVKYDREFAVVLSDWTFENPMRVLDKLKKQADYYNHQKRTVPDFFRDAAHNGWRSTLSDRLMWARMRMDPTDILDVTGHTYTYLINGASPDLNWTALFKPGERIRLRFINSASMTIFDVRIPGLKMTVFQADGQNVEPVEIEEFRVGPAETCDVIVEPREDAYCIFAESMDRSGYGAGTLAPREGMRAAIPPRRKRPIRTMADMGMAHSMNGMKGMQMPAGQSGGDQHQNMPGMKMPSGNTDASGHEGMPGMKMPPEHQMHNMKGMKMPSMMHGPDHHGPGNSMVAMMPTSRLSEPGTGLEDAGRRVLVYTDLRRLTPDREHGEAQRGIELHLTGNMERQMWGFDGKKFSEASAPIPLPFGEWFRITLVNDTMMDHPMHLHGMFMVLENGAGDRMPYKHTILVKAGEKLSFLVKPDERGPFAFHCHLLLHMELGMFRVVSVSETAMKGTK
jgi:CopA family copper-resistance protein